MEEANKITKKPHVLALPFPAQGHINPLLQFCKRLVSKDVKVTLVTTVYISKSMHGDQRGPILIETVSDGFDHGGFGVAGSPEEYISKFKDVGSRDLTNLIKKLEDTCDHVDAIIYDSLLTWALDVGKNFGLIGAAFFTQSCTVNYIYHQAYEKLLPLPLSTPVVSISGLPKLEASDMPSFVYNYGSYPGFYDLVVKQFSNVNQADWVFFNVFHKLEEEVLNLMAKLWRVRTMGPSIPSMYLDKRIKDDKDYGLNLFKPNFDECMNWLNKKGKASVVYVSFGSVAELGAEQFEEIAYALQSSGFYFLWVVRASEREKLPRKFIEEVVDKGTGLVVSWSPQLEVLAHYATGCFVTHCGLNSVLEAISLGVPMVAMPQWTDQTTNAKYVEDIWCMGFRAKQDEGGIVRREVLEMCIRDVMEGVKGNEIKKSSMKWRDLAKEAIDEGGSSDTNIDEFVAELKRSF